MICLMSIARRSNTKGPTADFGGTRTSGSFFRCADLHHLTSLHDVAKGRFGEAAQERRLPLERRQLAGCTKVAGIAFESVFY